MALPACDKCGKTNPRKMIGLMTLWFGSFVDREPDHGYFYLCPACYAKWVKPHFDLVQGRLAEMHPAGHHLDLHGRGGDAGGDRLDEPTPESGDGGEPSEPDADPVAAGASDGRGGGEGGAEGGAEGQVAG